MEIEYHGNNDWRDCYLAHHGIRGMHWGIRRFQPYSTTGPRKGGKTGKEVGLARRIGSRLSGSVKSVKAKLVKAKADKVRKANLEKARKIKAEKEAIMKSGDADKLLARKELFSDEEIDRFLVRAGKETKVAELRKQQLDAGFQKADEIQEKVRKIAGYIGTANDLVGQGVKLKKNLDDVAELMGAKKKKAMEEEGNKIANSGSAEEVLNAIRSGKLDANQTQTAKNRLDNQASIEKRMFEEGRKATEAATERLVNSGSAEEVLRGIREGRLNADQTQKSLNRLNNQKTIEGMLSKGETDIDRAIKEADAKSISENWGKMSSSQKKDAFDSITKKATIDKAIPKESDKPTKADTKTESSTERTFNNQWTNLGVQGANRNSPYNTPPKDKVEAMLRRDYGKMLGVDDKWGNAELNGKSYSKKTSTEASTKPELGGSKYNQPQLPMKNRSEGGSSSKPRTIDTEVVNGKAIPVSGSSRKALPGPTSSTSSSKKPTGPLTLNPSAETKNYNKSLSENMRAYTKKASDLSKQTESVDSGRDYVSDLLKKTKLG